MTTAVAHAPALVEAAIDPALVTDASVTGVMIQFFSKNRDLIPPRFNRMNRQGKARHNNASEKIIPTTGHVALTTIFDDLSNAGFVLADGFSYERASEESTQFGRSLLVMRFQFYPARTFEFESEDKKKRAEGDLALFFSRLVTGAYWEVSAFNNVMSSGSHAIGIKCGARFITTNPNGSPLTRKPRDAHGEPCGEPQPFVPQHNGQLRIINGNLLLA